MFKNFEIDNTIDIPIYRQLTDMIRAKVSSGELPEGTRMPTVRDMAEMLSVAQGTVKRAYDELESLGVIEKTQGKGTFIKAAETYSDEASESRKDRAMAAIDRMFDQLETMGFSGTEIDIFLDLKKRERESRRQKTKVAIVECNPEILYNLVEQARGPELDIYPYLLSDIQNYPYKIGEDVELIITSAKHFDELANLVPQKEKLARIALSLATSSVHQILMIPQKSKVGILSGSYRFGEMIGGEIEKYNLKIDVEPAITFSECPAPATWISRKDYILVPENYETYCTPEMREELEKAAKKGKLIPCVYRMDQGSAFQVEERIKAAKARR